MRGAEPDLPGPQRLHHAVPQGRGQTHLHHREESQGLHQAGWVYGLCQIRSVPDRVIPSAFIRQSGCMAFVRDGQLKIGSYPGCSSGRVGVWLLSDKVSSR